MEAGSATVRDSIFRLCNATLGTAPIAGATAAGGAIVAHLATFDITSTTFDGNEAPVGAAISYESRPSFTSISKLSLSTFVNNLGSSTVFAPTPITWNCQLGQWSPQTGTVPGDFDGCGFLCAAGSMGAQRDHVTPTCSGSCPIGHYCPAGTVTPNACDAGYRMPVVGAASQGSCIPCSPGSRQPSAGEGSCIACDKGKFSANLASTVCNLCPIGGFCGLIGAASASQTFEQCPAGTYNPDLGAVTKSSCRACSPGKANPVPGSSDAAVCLDCLPGSAAGFGGAAICLLCEAGKYQSERGKTGCNACTSGYLCVEGSSAPQPCPGGYHANQTVLAVDGFLSTLDDCVRCGVGVYCPVGSNTPTVCAAGTYNDQLNASMCVKCPGGEYQSASGETACKACTAGNFCPEGASAPLPCAGGTYSKTANINAASGCMAVNAGKFAPTGSTQQTPCAKGTYTDASITVKDSCTACAGGTYQDVEGQTACMACTPGCMPLSAACACDATCPRMLGV